MIYKKTFTSFFLCFLFTTATFGQTNKPKEYLGVAGPITFDKMVYSLAWTSHPSTNYYKQEYLAKGETIGKFKKMITLEILTGKTILKDIVATKVAELKSMKAANPIVNYELFQKNGEYILDFLVSENTADGKSIAILERNVYRYKTVTEKNGQLCILLLGVSERAYGNDSDNFLLKLKGTRGQLTNVVAKFIIPKIIIAK